MSSCFVSVSCYLSGLFPAVCILKIISHALQPVRCFSDCYSILAVFIYCNYRYKYHLNDYKYRHYFYLFSYAVSQQADYKQKKRRNLKYLSVFFTLAWIFILYTFIHDHTLFECGIWTISLQAFQLLIGKECNQ